MKLAEYEAVVFCIRMARKTGSTRVVNGVLRLVVGKEPLKPPAPGALIEVGVFDHHVDSSAIAFEDDSVLLLGLAQFVHDDRAVGEITGRVAVDRFWICEDVVHSLFALGQRAAREDDSGANVNPAPEVAGILDRFGGAQVAER